MIYFMNELTPVEMGMTVEQFISSKGIIDEKQYYLFKIYDNFYIGKLVLHKKVDDSYKFNGYVINNVCIKNHTKKTFIVQITPNMVVNTTEDFFNEIKSLYDFISKPNINVNNSDVISLKDAWLGKPDVFTLSCMDLLNFGLNTPIKEVYEALVKKNQNIQVKLQDEISFNEKFSFYVFFKTYNDRTKILVPRNLSKTLMADCFSWDEDGKAIYNESYSLPTNTRLHLISNFNEVNAIKTQLNQYIKRKSEILQKLNDLLG